MLCLRAAGQVYKGLHIRSDRTSASAVSSLRSVSSDNNVRPSKTSTKFKMHEQLGMVAQSTHRQHGSRSEPPELLWSLPTPFSSPSPKFPMLLYAWGETNIPRTPLSTLQACNSLATPAKLRLCEHYRPHEHVRPCALLPGAPLGSRRTASQPAPDATLCRVMVCNEAARPRITV